MALEVKSVKKSRMTGDCQVRFCERLGVKLPRSTRLLFAYFPIRFFLSMEIPIEIIF